MEESTNSWEHASGREDGLVDAPGSGRLTSRRASLRALGLLGAGAGLVTIAACSGESSSASSTSSAASSSSSDSSSTTADGDCTATPPETGGPFPADGTNDDGNGSEANVLDDDGIIRADIRSDLDGSDTQEGVPFALKVNVQDSQCAPMPGAAVYVWHCNKEGEYSAYNSQMIGGDFTAHQWLRGVQVADSEGNLEFSTILPGRYQGRAFHIHFEVYADDSFSDKLLTSQMAMDDELVNQLFTEAGYTDALRNDTSNSRDGIFSDGFSQQLLTVTGDVESGLTASITVVT